MREIERPPYTICHRKAIVSVVANIPYEADSAQQVSACVYMCIFACVCMCVYVYPMRSGHDTAGECMIS